MKTIITTCIFTLFLCAISFGQISLKAFNYRPTGEFGMTMKPLISVEIGWQDRFSRRSTKRWRYGFSLQYLNMKPRMEVFPVYAVGDNGNGFQVFPGHQSFQRYAILQLMGGGDFAFIHKEKLNVYAGASLIVGAASIDYTDIIEGWKNESYSGGGILGGGRVRLGAEYAFTDNFALFFDMNRNGFLVAEPLAFLTANDYGLGARYSFE
jgi:hypothetical protein